MNGDWDQLLELKRKHVNQPSRVIALITVGDKRKLVQQLLQFWCCVAWLCCVLAFEMCTCNCITSIQVSLSNSELQGLQGNG